MCDTDGILLIYCIIVMRCKPLCFSIVSHKDCSSL